MRQVIIIGSPGAGKSTFARKLRDLTGLPLYHLDRIWHKPDRTTITKPEFNERLAEILAQDEWIIDGNYKRTIEMRLAACDTVFLMDYPVDVCLAGVQERVGVWHDDLPWVEEILDEEFRQWVEDFPNEQLPEIYRLIEQYREDRKVVILHSREEADAYLAEYAERIRFFERIAANGHVPLETMDYDGWELRFAEGYTGRANSVLPLGPSQIAVEDKVAVCEEHYHSRGLPASFKLTGRDMELDRFLEAQGYAKLTPTDVMTLELAAKEDATAKPGASPESCGTSSADTAECVFTDEQTEEWLAAYFAHEGITDARKRGIFRAMLAKVAVDTVYCALVRDGRIDAVASAAIEQGYALIHNVVVAPECRGRGLGRKLCAALIGKVAERGAKTAYLQVVQTNDIAKKLYRTLGFERVYTYWYRREQDERGK